MIGAGDRSFELYGLSEQPFGESPDPRYFYMSAELSRTFAALLHNLETFSPLQSLIANPGLGKTTLLHALLARLNQRFISAFVFQTFGGPAELLGFVIRALGLTDLNPALVARRECLERFFATHKRGSRPFLLVIDEAHNLNNRALEEVERLLAKAPQTLQVILSGQAQLEAALIKGPRTLFDSVEAKHHLSPLPFEDTGNYVRHRLEVAGYKGQELFTREALDLIAEESSGIPRNINTICYHALEYGSRRKLALIDEGVVTYVLPNCPFREQDSNKISEADSLSPVEMNVAPPARNQESLILAEMIRGWLFAHAESWAGTAWELDQQLRSAAPMHFERLAIRSSAELAECITRNSLPLRQAGIEVEIRRRGKARKLVLRLVEDSLSRRIA